MAEMMRAVRFHDYGGSEKLILENIPRPVPAPGEVLVHVHFAGVNPMDWKIRSGMLRDFMPVGLPSIPGSDFSGVVEEAGPGTELKKGQEVFGIGKGTYAEYSLAASGDITPKPGNLSFEKAATLPIAALTAWKTVEDAGIRAGEIVIVLGAAGGVGHFAVQFAKAKGALVIGTSSIANLDFVKTALGAWKSIDYNSGDLEKETGTADVLIDTVGGKTLDNSYTLLKKGGVLLTIAGQVSQEKSDQYGIRAMRSGRGPASLLKPIAELASEKLIIEVGKIFPLEQAAEAQDLSQAGHGRGHIVLKA